jgi:cell wall-associated NlpC family hydrolase
MPAAFLAALIAAALAAPSAAAQIPNQIPVGWGGHGDERGDRDGDGRGNWADDWNDDDDEEPAADDGAGDGSAPGWLDGDDITPGGGDEPGAELLPPGGARPVIKGRVAALGSNGVAYAPSKAPRQVKLAIWAANQLRAKPYKWGGGHGRWKDSGYDCSGSVSYALHAAGLLNAPLTSGTFTRYGKSGLGKWISIYANKGHVFMVVAGLRFDTSAYGSGAKGPRWRLTGRPAKGFKVRHPAGL